MGGMWMWYSAGWMLPTFGFIVGILTNWIALKMIFEPVQPVHVCGFKIQGLFLQRQQEVSEVYAQIITDNYLGMTKLIVRFFRSEAKIQRCKKVVAEHVLEHLPDTGMHVERYMDTAMNLEDVLRAKLASLPSADFEGLLHPVFQEDEWKLVLM